MLKKFDFDTGETSVGQMMLLQPLDHLKSRASQK